MYIYFDKDFSGRQQVHGRLTCAHRSPTYINKYKIRNDIYMCIALIANKVG